jgi:phospholipid/cholesterol/gamma-HCH transport system ATP-binding protein
MNSEMAEILRVEQLSQHEIPVPISFAVARGSMTILVTPKEEINWQLVRLFLYLDKPCSGKIYLYNSDSSSLSDRDQRDIRRKIGIVPPSGGLVSNLTVWENLTLPLYYHQSLSHGEIKARGMAVLDRLGFTGKLMAATSTLTAVQKKMIGFARAMITAPDFMLYESPASRLDQNEMELFFNVAREFHYEKPGRASLFITSRQDTARFLPEAGVVNLIRGQVI